MKIILLLSLIIGYSYSQLVTLTSANKAELVNLHNTPRAKYGVPALAWNDNAETSARSWASYLQTLGCFNLTHSTYEGRNRYGENLSAWSGSGRTVGFGAQLWNDEEQYWSCNPIPSYNMNNNCGGNWGRCGHFTQVINRDTSQLGCGLATCSGGRYVLVCHYGPPATGHGNNGRHPTGFCPANSNPTPTPTPTPTSPTSPTTTTCTPTTLTRTISTTVPGPTITRTVGTQTQTVTRTVTSTASSGQTVTRTVTNTVPATTVTQTVTSTVPSTGGTRCFQLSAPFSRCIQPGTHLVFGNQFAGRSDCFFYNTGNFCFTSNTTTSLSPCNCFNI